MDSETTAELPRPARSTTRSWLAAVAALAVAALSSACAQSRADLPETPVHGIYVSIGDSYAAGNQAGTDGRLTATRNSFPYLIADRVAAAGGRLRLLNFGCTSVTSDDLLHKTGCPQGFQGPDGPAYPHTTQAQAAVNALRAHRDQVRLVTIVIGGNDVNACLRPDRGALSPAELACLDRAGAALRANLAELLTEVRDATGPAVPIVGLTYPDIFLGAWVAGDEASREFASASVGLFRDRLNAVLKDSYAAAAADFVDITEATGGYGPLTGPGTETTQLAPYGTLPVPVARVCALTFACAMNDPHPTNDGYATIADEVLRRVELN